MKKRTYTTLAAIVLCSAALAACSPAGSADTEPQSDTTVEMSATADSQSFAEEKNMPGESAYHKITAGEAKEMMDEGGVTVVDVRRPDEYAAGHIPGSVLVPVEGITDTQPKELPDLDAVLLVHCRTGIRSKQASDKLVEMGYKNVYDFGGIVDWPYETVTE